MQERENTSRNMDLSFFWYGTFNQASYLWYDSVKTLGQRTFANQVVWRASLSDWASCFTDVLQVFWYPRSERVEKNVAKYCNDVHENVE